MTQGWYLLSPTGEYLRYSLDDAKELLQWAREQRMDGTVYSGNFVWMVAFYQDTERMSEPQLPAYKHRTRLISALERLGFSYATDEDVRLYNYTEDIEAVVYPVSTI